MTNLVLDMLSLRFLKDGQDVFWGLLWSENVTFGAISLQVVTQTINVAWNHSEWRKGIQHQKNCGPKVKSEELQIIRMVKIIETHKEDSKKYS